MFEKLHITPIENEQPSDYADRLGVSYAKQVSQKHKKDNGQFFTPVPIARLMTSFCENTKSSIRILDPGCGTAILSCALIENIVEQNSNIKVITLDVSVG
jgi:adenine-specific DNA-methyltransferase